MISYLPDRRTARLLLVCTLALVMAGCGSPEDRKAEYMDSGREWFEQENYEKARVALKNVLQIDPEDVDARLLLARTFERLNEPDKAVAQYQGALEIAPGHLEGMERLAQLLLSGGGLERAMELAAELLETDPDHVGGLAIRGAVHNRRGEVEAAIADAERAHELDPRDGRAVALLAAVRTDQGREAEAREILRKGVEANPDDVALRAVLANLYLRNDQSDAAVQMLEEVARLQPENAAHRVRIAQLYAQLGQTAEAKDALRQGIADLPEEVDLKVTLASYIRGTEGEGAAERQLQQFIAAEPRVHKLRFALARLYLAQERTEDAKDVYGDVIKLAGTDPDGLTARTRMARLLAAEGDIEGSRTMLEEVLAESPRDIEARTVRASLHLAEGDARSAIVDYREALRSEPESVTLLRRLAQAHLSNDERGLAIENLSRALELQPDNVELRLQVAQLFAQDDRPDRATEVIRRGVELMPNDTRLLEARFRTQVANEDWEGALETARRVEALDPAGATGPYLVGMALLGGEEDLDATIAKLREAVARAPQALEPLSALVRAYLAAERRSEAVTVLEEVVAANARNAAAHSMLGQLYLLERRPAEAEASFRRAMELAPESLNNVELLAMTRLGQGDREGALQAYEDAVEASNGAAAIRFVLAKRYEALGRHEDAIAQYQAIHDADPESISAANNLAMMLATYRDDAQSLERAWELTRRFADTDRPGFLDTIGWVLFRQGRVDEALPLVERAAEALPEEPVVQYHAGMVNRAAGNYGRARELLEKALSSESSFPQMERAREALGALTDAEVAAES
jgi:tetratricopeptide (TPR) repeat protein